MPCKRRFILPHMPLHIVQRGHSRNPVFFEETDYRAYLGWLKEGAARYNCAIHAYVTWSSYRYNGQGKSDNMITPHPAYLALGNSESTRLLAYQSLFKAHIDNGALDDIRTAWQTVTPLGNHYFKENVEAKLKCKVGQARRGRPMKIKNQK